MDVKYQDGPAARLVDGQREPVQRGATVTVPDEQGKKLLKQGWEQVRSAPLQVNPATKATPKVAPKKED